MAWVWKELLMDASWLNLFSEINAHFGLLKMSMEMHG